MGNDERGPVHGVLQAVVTVPWPPGHDPTPWASSSTTLVRDATQAPDGTASNDLIHHTARSTSEPNRTESANAIVEYLK